MAPSLRTVVRRMGLRSLAGSLDSAVRWVAVSELEDPTPFLEGDELLLTTGMRLEGDFSGYVARLVARGVAGLGFGVGLSHDEVPPALVTAAEEAGLPLLEVPRETPFIAIGKTVGELLAAEQYEEITRAFAAQGRLTRAALRPEGLHAVVDRLAAEVGGWAVLLDETGQVRHATRGARAEAVTGELGRLRGTRMPASLSLSGPEGHVVLQPLGGGARPRGYFAVGAREAFTPVAHTVINAAGSLLTLALEQGGAQREAARRVRQAVLELLLAGEDERARAVLDALGGRLPGEPFAVLAVPAEALESVEATVFATRLPQAAGGGAPVEGGAAGGAGVVLVEEGAADEVAGAVEGAVGVSTACRYGELRAGIDQAVRARAASRGGVVRFAELAGQGLVGLLDPAVAQAFATALLGPLTAYGARPDLVASLRAYLECNGHWDAAAQRLGVHRHTLRYRMRRVAELLGRDLDDPAVRAELWFALEAARR
ncbi:PucR family transcriptional regulator [Nonomuraea ceibae]|uniref:PucR family transcriptional regulator n=1 Tax=Nonomuraea ceibae TaxID=1935170 RepID=UPI001C5CF5EB|nr:PucR family transcriptional regulator [Nonomuraea ceibae]